MGVFPDDMIRRVRDANDIVQVVESYRIELRRSGGNFVAVCPFHREKTPSFNVNPQKQIFKCFGCGKGGDVFSFVQEMERAEFPEAVELLAARAGLEVTREKGRGRPSRDEGPESRRGLLWVNAQALRYFEDMLADRDEGRLAREYLLERGFTEATISTWRLGWAPDRWDGLLSRLVTEAGPEKREALQKACVAAGIARRKEGEAGRSDRVYDAFRGRVMFPILDNQHRPVGFGGRVLVETENSGGKYINTSEGKLFQKRKLLFGLNFAAKEIGLTRQAIVVEGYTDTIMCHQHGIRNVVATLGTSLTREHVTQLRRYVQPDGRIVAMFDSDQAGENATRRAIEMFMEEDVPLSIVRDLELKDACEFLPKYGAENFAQRVKEAEDAFRFVLRRSLAESHDDVSGRAAAVARIMDVANRSPDPVKRAMMRREVAAATGVPEEALPKRRPGTGSGGGRERRRGLHDGAQSPAQAETRHSSRVLEQALQKKRRPLEQRLLKHMLEREDWHRRIREVLPPEDFTDAACVEAARLITEAWTQGRAPDVRDLIQAATHESVAPLLTDLADWNDAPEASEDELQTLLRRLHHEQSRKRHAALTDGIQSAQREGKTEIEDELLRRKREEILSKRKTAKPKTEGTA